MKSNTARHLLAAAVCVLLLAAASAFGDEMALPWPDLSSAPRPAAKKGHSSSGDAALVIGISNYIFLDKVEGAVSNADDWREYLRKSRNIARQNIGFLTDKDATDVEIRSEARRIAALAKPGSTIWFVFIGHGAAASNGEEGLLVGADAQGSASGLDARSVRQSEIEAIFNKSKASRVVMIVDACFSGRTSEGKALAPGLQALVRPAQLKANARTILMTAARSDQFAGPLPGAHRPAFSYLLLGALRGWADENNDKTVTAEEALNYVQGVFVSLVRGHRQTPELTASNTNRQAVLAAHVSEKGPDIDAMVRQKFKRDVSAEAPVKNSNKNKINNKNNHDDDDDDDDNDNDKDDDDDDDDDNDNDNKKNNKAGEYIRIPAGALVLSHHTAGNLTGHTVKLDAFALKKTPVTVAEFEKCAAAGKCSKEHYKTAAEMASCNYNRGGDWNSHPMNCVDWYGAKEFCEWSGGRLPTEDEWEYASAHDGRENFKAKYPWAGQYPWGSRKPAPSIANFGGNVGTTTAVGKYSPVGDSRLGLVDMSGNVWEWTFSVSPRDKENKSYVIRGGSWKTSADRVRVTFGIEASPAHMDGELGLRCVKPMVSGTTAAAPGNNNRIQKQNEYIHIPGGSFVLSHNTGKYRKTDTVALDAFELKQTPVTVAEFQKCAAAGACRAENYDAFLEHAGCNYNRGDDYLDHPMNCVNMAGAKEYCEWSGGRLPTEEEWEYAATHDGAKHLETKYPWGNKDPDKSTANYLLDYYTGETTPVGRYSPAGDSPLGLVDMSGNVWEWTDSFYEFGASSDKALRVLKSDAYCASDGPKWDLLVTNRTSGEPKKRGKPIGFRCVKTKAAGTKASNENSNQNTNNTIQKENAGEYIQIPAGSFAARIATRNHRGGDTVTLKAFELKKTPVTVAEFQKCVAAGACRPDNFEDAKEKSECNYNRGNDWLNHPMNCVTWEGAREYCAWSGGRLPTDDEWEYAAAHDGKAHLRTSYPWGNKSPNSTNANGAHSRRFSTSAVGAHSPAGDSPLGLVDMLGNVWEFTSSRSFGPAGYVVMGGSWKDQLRSLSMREEGFSARNDVGFRCAR